MQERFDLLRFVAAQADLQSGFDVALGELQAGQKRSHWIWYIFPQLEGLGSSPMAVKYGVSGMGEATAYLRDPLLGGRLVLVATAVANQLRRQPPASLDHVMGSRIDAQKVVSSMTLFREVARRLNASEPSAEHETLAREADTILQIAAAQGLPPCRATLWGLRDNSI